VGLTDGDVHFNYLLYAVALGEQKLEREGGNSRRGIITARPESLVLFG
jgi:hypothetical protein